MPCCSTAIGSTYINVVAVLLAPAMVAATDLSPLFGCGALFPRPVRGVPLALVTVVSTTAATMFLIVLSFDTKPPDLSRRTKGIIRPPRPPSTCTKTVPGFAATTAMAAANTTTAIAAPALGDMSPASAPWPSFAHVGGAREPGRRRLRLGQR